MFGISFYVSSLCLIPFIPVSDFRSVFTDLEVFPAVTSCNIER